MGLATSTMHPWLYKDYAFPLHTVPSKTGPTCQPIRVGSAPPNPHTSLSTVPGVPRGARRRPRGGEWVRLCIYGTRYVLCKAVRSRMRKIYSRAVTLLVYSR